MRKILNSAGLLTVIYSFISLIVIIVYRFINPDFPISRDILKIFLFRAKFFRGLLNYIDLFPAIVMSGLALHFAVRPRPAEGGRRFSPKFFDSMKVPLITCIAAAVFYTFCFLFIKPMIFEKAVKFQNESLIYREAFGKLKKYYNSGDWILAGYFGNVCNMIWSDDPESLTANKGDRLKDLLPVINAEALSSRLRERSKSPAGIVSPGEGRTSYQSSAQSPVRHSSRFQEPLNAAEAVKFAGEALEQKKYYDAAWLGNLASRLAPPESVENMDGTRIAGLAREEISKSAPSPREEASYSIYRRKREGYEAILNENWIRAYYIFKDLIPDAPSDNDIKNFFFLSEKNLKTMSFFLDEMNLMFSAAQQDALFSLPDTESGRLVIKTAALTEFAGFSLGRDIEVLSFDSGKKPVFRMQAPFMKVIPVEINGKWQSVILLRAIDRDRQDIGEGPVWTSFDGKERRDTALLLPVSYEQFVLAGNAKNSIGDFFINELFLAAETLSGAGFIPQVFYVEIIRQLYLPLLSLALFVFALITGWRFRATSKAGLSIPLMLVVLPVIFSVFVSLVRLVFDFITIWSVLSYGFTAGCVTAVGFSVILFILSLFLLAAQRSPE